MVIAAIAFFVIGVYSLAKPVAFLGYLKIPTSPVLEWALQMMGIIMIALSIHQATTSRNAADPAFRRAALLSVLVEFGLSALTYLGPGEFTRLRWTFIGASALVGLLYLITLPIKSIGYQEENPVSSH